MSHHIGKMTGRGNPRLTGCDGEHQSSHLATVSSGGRGSASSCRCRRTPRHRGGPCGSVPRGRNQSAACRRRHLLRHLRLPDHLADPRRDARRALLTSELLRAPHPPHLSRAFPGACRLLGPGTVAVHAAGLGSVRPEFWWQRRSSSPTSISIGDSGYFDAPLDTKPLLHTWSLCDRRAILHRLSTHSAASPPLGWPALDRGRPRSLCFVACGFDPDHSG